MVDRRVARTKTAVIGAFEALLDEKGYAPMTVQDILDAANVGRATFYAHFEGKEGVMRAFVEAVIDHVAAPATAEVGHDFTGRDGITAQVEHALRHVLEHGHAIRALLIGGGADVFVHALRAAATSRLEEAASSYEAHFLAGALVETIIWWAETDFEQDPQTLAASYAKSAKAVLDAFPLDYGDITYMMIDNGTQAVHSRH